MAIGVFELDGHLDVVAGHAHLGLAAVLRQQVEDRAGHVGGPEVELRPVALEERRVPAALRPWSGRRPRPRTWCAA